MTILYVFILLILLALFLVTIWTTEFYKFVVFCIFIIILLYSMYDRISKFLVLIRYNKEISQFISFIVSVFGILFPCSQLHILVKLGFSSCANWCWFRFLSILRYLNFSLNVSNLRFGSIIDLRFKCIGENIVANVALLYTLHMQS